MGKSPEIETDPELLKDENYLAFRDSFEELLEEHEDKYVAFVDGELIEVKDTLEEILQALNTDELAEKDAFVKQVERHEKIISMGGPRVDQ